MTAEEFNAKEIAEGRLTAAHLVIMIGEAGYSLETIVRAFQRKRGLLVDGKAGETTRDVAEKKVSTRCWPLRCLPDGRRPKITSGFKAVNPSRPTHNGVDMFYEYLDTDPEVQIGDGGAIVKHGDRRWWYPPGARIVAAADGKVTTARKISTGWSLWIAHPDGWRTGYFHCRQLLVDAGARVVMGQEIAIPGDSPLGYDATHLHFEVSPINGYIPTNPEAWLADAAYLPAE